MKNQLQFTLIAQRDCKIIKQKNQRGAASHKILYIS
jgi:hypothetical protein